MIFDEFWLPEIWETILPDVQHLKPFVSLCGLDPSRWEDIEGIAFTLAQIKFDGLVPYREHYDGPAYRLRDAGKRIVAALLASYFASECEKRTGIDCREEGFCACQGSGPRSNDDPER